MRKLLVLFTSIYILGCGNQKQMTISDKLQSVDYFKYIEGSNKLHGFKRLIDEEKASTNWLTFYNNRYLNSQLNIEDSIDISTPDFRSVEIYGDDMYEGNFKSYLEDIKPIFEMRGLKFELGEEEMFWGKKTNDDQFLKHMIPINNIDYLIFEGNIQDRSINQPLKYVKRTLEVLNKELLRQNFEEKFVIVTHRECVYYILGSTEIIETIRDLTITTKNELIEK